MHPHAYRLLTHSPAKKKAKKLLEIVDLMGFDVRLSRAQELVAGLMGYADWAELTRVTKEAPERGVPDQMLPPKAAAARREFQRALLVSEFDVDESDADGILAALAPTGDAVVNWPSFDKLRLRLAEDDLAWLDAAMTLVRDFDAAVRPLYRISPAPASAMDPRGLHGLTHVRVEVTVPGKRERVVRNTEPSDIVGWVASGFPVDAPLAGETLAEVTDRAEAACRIFRELDRRIRDLGAAPMLAPIDWTFLMLHRARVWGDVSYYTAICPEPWLHIGFALPGFCFNPENEWNASRALALQLALRREFLDAGWTGDGPEWRVTFREGNSAKEEMIVRASTAGDAFAWVAAARGALRLAKNQSVGVVSLLSVIGPDGAVAADQAFRGALARPIVERGKLLRPDRLRVRMSKKAA